MSESKSISIIVAYDKNHAIGIQNRIPWFGNLPADMKHFRAKTLGKTVLMGRNTFDSLPNGPLPERKNIVMSRDETLEIEGAMVVSSIKSALSACSDDELVVIGGGLIYDLALPYATKVYATEIDATFEGADTFFISINNGWVSTTREEHNSDERNLYAYNFVEYERI